MEQSFKLMDLTYILGDRKNINALKIMGPDLEQFNIHKNVQIGTREAPVEYLEIGPGSRLFGGKIMCKSFRIGSFVTIHDGVWCGGRSTVQIGHNSWFGQDCTIDAEANTWKVGNNFGAGQGSHMWGHIAHGNRLDGCQYYSFNDFIAEDDVWLVGRCTASPGVYRRHSVAFPGSVLTKGMGRNSVWGGNPAKDITSKVGVPYRPITLEQREELFDEAFDAMYRKVQGIYYDNHVDHMNKLRNLFDMESLGYTIPSDPSLRSYLFRYIIPNLNSLKLRFTPINYPGDSFSVTYDGDLK